jgi:ribosomal protein L11 methyltransferase
MQGDWLELEFPLGEHDAERVSEALEALGALAVTMTDGGDDPVYEPPPGATPLWQATRVRALFDPREDRAALRAGLAAALCVAGHALPTLRFAELADREWAREWLAHFQPMRFGKRLWVVPTAYQPPEADAVNLVLDPGLAFGTGTHPTTALCLEWLDASGEALAGRTAIDYGCGSGILAIAAALLGARQVWAVDLDPQALEATAENAARNGVGERLRIGAPALVAGRQADLLVANILAGPLRELAPALMAALPPGAPFALSGILADQAEEVAAAYRPFATLAAPVVRGDWVRLDGRRRAA